MTRAFPSRRMSAVLRVGRRIVLRMGLVRRECAVVDRERMGDPAIGILGAVRGKERDCGSPRAMAGGGR